MRLTDWASKRFYPLLAVFVLVWIALLVGGLLCEDHVERDWVRDNTGRRWEIRHIEKQEFLYSRGRLVFLRPCRCGKDLQDSL